MFQDLRTTGFGCPGLPETLPYGPDMMRDAVDVESEETFKNADLDSVYRYLRGGKRLKIPPAWRLLVPAREA